MSDDRKPGTAARLGRTAMGERLGGFIYGTVVVLAVVVAGARAFPHEPGHIAVLVVITTLVFWVAHVYAHGLAYSVAHDQHLSLAELRHIARQEGSIVEAGVPPLAALVLGAFGVLSTQVCGLVGDRARAGRARHGGSHVRAGRAACLARDGPRRGRKPRSRPGDHRPQAARDPLRVAPLEPRRSPHGRHRAAVSFCSSGSDASIAGPAGWNLEADEPVHDVEDRAQEVEEAVREVRGRRHAEHAGDVGAAGVPRHEHRGDRARVLDRAREHLRREPAPLELAAEHPARQDVGDVLVAGDHVEPDAAPVDGEDQPSSRRARAPRPAGGAARGSRRAP